MNQLFEMYKRAELQTKGPTPLYDRHKVPLWKTFIAGADPSGVSTFNIARRASNHKENQVVGTTAGVISGVAALPSAVSGMIGGVKGAIKTHGGIKKRIIGAAQGFGIGAISPYKQIYHGFAAGKALGESKRLGKVTPEALHHIQNVLGIEMSGKSSQRLSNLSSLIGKSKTFREGAGKLQKYVGGQTKMIAAGFGASGAIGGLSSYVQYNQGKDIGDKEIAFNRKIRGLEAQKKA